MNNQEEGLHNIRHSLAHLLAIAVLKFDPAAKLAIGPVIDNGFYYDFLLSKLIKETDLPKIEKEMRKQAERKLNFIGKEVSKEEALDFFREQPFKKELIEEFSKDGLNLTTYTTGSFTDLCRGGHVQNTSEIPVDAFKLERIAGSYWRGDEKNATLIRIYGLAFETKNELDNYIALQEEARKRDHKKLGPELDLFTFSELVGKGLPLWTPKGTILRTVLDDFVWSLRKAHGYQKVEIPHITKKDLYIKSGHWDKFKDELFKIVTREGHEFAMKPMNCPHHTQIFARKPHSYREMPQRYANTTAVYRDEQSGELAGLSRVRCITQDDAHVFCRHSQVKEEILVVWDIIQQFYSAVGFILSVRLSLHDEAHMEKYLGTEEIWKNAENQLRIIVKDKGVSAIEALGEAAFYGPKIDFMAKDSLGREWQVATIQLDMNLPERFNLSCKNEKGNDERIVMVHAAIMGSIERYLSIIIEHFAGAFPTWLSPTQAVILPISEKFADYAKDLYSKLKTADIRVELDDQNETLGKRIRNNKMLKIPYLVVVGQNEVDLGTITAESRDKGQIKDLKVGQFISLLQEEIKNKK